MWNSIEHPMVPVRLSAAWRFLLGATILGVLTLATVPVQANDAIGSLWKLVRDDAGIVIEGRELSKQLKGLVDSPVRQRLSRLAIWKSILASPEWNRVLAANTTIESITDLSLKTWAEKTLGNACLVVVYADKTRQPMSVVLSKLENSNDFDQLLVAWQKVDSRVESQHQYQGTTYYSRAKTDSGSKPTQSIYFVNLSGTVALSEHSLLIERVIADFTSTSQKPPETQVKQTQPVTGPTIYQEVRESLHPNSFIRVFAQPAIWATNPSLPDDSSDPGERWLKNAWRSCQTIGVSIRHDRGLILELSAISNVLDQAERWKSIVKRVSGPPGFQKHIPPRAIAAISGRHALADIALVVQDGLPSNVRKLWTNQRQVVRGFLMGRDLIDDILPDLPADFGGYVVPAVELRSDRLALDALVALSIPGANEAVHPADKPSSNQESDPADPAIRQRQFSIPVKTVLENTLRTGFYLVVSLYNASGKQGGPAAVEIRSVDGISVSTITGIEQIEPTFAVTDAYLVLATSPKTVHEFLKPSPPENQESTPKLAAWKQEVMSGASQIVELRGNVASEFLLRNREFFSRQFETLGHLKPDEAKQRFNRLVDWCQVVDSAVLAIHVRPKSVYAVFGLAVIEP